MMSARVISRLGGDRLRLISGVDADRPDRSAEAERERVGGGEVVGDAVAEV
jgi:hypothetical protein